jgi:hypothetical protein
VPKYQNTPTVVQSPYAQKSGTAANASGVFSNSSNSQATSSQNSTGGVAYQGGGFVLEKNRNASNPLTSSVSYSPLTNTSSSNQQSAQQTINGHVPVGNVPLVNFANHVPVGVDQGKQPTNIPPPNFTKNVLVGIDQQKK